MSNRVEELESKVAELQAAVNGLTEELVETKERVRELEDAAEVEVATTDSSGAETDAGERGRSDDEGAKSAEDEDRNDEGASEPDDNDIIVA